VRRVAAGGGFRLGSLGGRVLSGVVLSALAVTVPMAVAVAVAVLVPVSVPVDVSQQVRAAVAREVGVCDRVDDCGDGGLGGVFVSILVCALAFVEVRLRGVESGWIGGVVGLVRRGPGRGRMVV